MSAAGSWHPTTLGEHTELTVAVGLKLNALELMQPRKVHEPSSFVADGT